MKYNNASELTGLTALANGDLVMFAVDASTGEVWIGDYATNTWYNSGDPEAGTGAVVTLTGTLYPACSINTSGSSVVNTISLPAPTGFARL